MTKRVSAPEVTEKIYELLNSRIDPTERRKLIEEVIHKALNGKGPYTNGQTFDERLEALEKHSHEPFDFTELISRIEKLENPVFNIAHIENRLSAVESRVFNAIVQGGRLTSAREKS